eukprot:gene24642-43876_t
MRGVAASLCAAVACDPCRIQCAGPGACAAATLRCPVHCNCEACKGAQIVCPDTSPFVDVLCVVVSTAADALDDIVVDGGSSVVACYGTDVDCGPLVARGRAGE